MAVKKAQPQKNSTKIRTSIISATLEVASYRPWESVSFIEIADSAGISVNDVQRFFPRKSDILMAIIDDLDAQVESSFPNYDESMSPRDRIFDVFMERFDIANQHRDAHISFFKSFGWTRDETCSDIGMMKNSMIRMAKCAGLNIEGLLGALRVTGLSATYIWVVLTWMYDTSPDLSKTMAELDKTLGRIDMLKSMMDNYAARSARSS